jgi:hypothetical protein
VTGEKLNALKDCFVRTLMPVAIKPITCIGQEEVFLTLAEIMPLWFAVTCAPNGNLDISFLFLRKYKIRMSYIYSQKFYNVKQRL